MLICSSFLKSIWECPMTNKWEQGGGFASVYSTSEISQGTVALAFSLSTLY